MSTKQKGAQSKQSDIGAEKVILTKQEKKAQYKAYYNANRAAISAHKKAYYNANKDAISAHNKAYYNANRDAIRARAKQLCC